MHWAQWYSFLLPSIICLILITYLPTITGFRYSLTDVTVLGFGEGNFVGFRNYRVLISSSAFIRAFNNTIILILIGYLVIPLGYILAVLINSLGRGRVQSFFRVGFFIPNVITGISTILLFRHVLLQHGGLLNMALSAITNNTVQIGWLVDPSINKFGVSIMSIWAAMGYTMLICLTGLQNVPREIYEAAEVDGAGAVQRWWYITTPNMIGIFIFLFITNTIAGFSRFTDLYVVSNNSASGGAAAALQSLIMYIYMFSFETPNFGFSSAGAIIVFVIVFVVTMINMRVIKMFNR